MTNEARDYSFSTYKLILNHISPVFRDMLEGDAELEELVLRGNVTKEAIQVLERVIFMKNADRVSQQLKAEDDFGSKFGGNAMESLILLHAKYDIEILNRILINAAVRLVTVFENLTYQSLNRVLRSGQVTKRCSSI